MAKIKLVTFLLPKSENRLIFVPFDNIDYLMDDIIENQSVLCLKSGSDIEVQGSVDDFMKEIEAHKKQTKK